MLKKKGMLKFLKWSFIVAIIILIILSGIAWFLNLKYKPILTAEIKRAVYKSTDGLYTIDFTNVNTNLITGNATLKNVKLIYSEKRYQELIDLKLAPNNLYIISLKKLSVKSFHPFDLITNRELNIDEILFDEPNIKMINRQFSFNDKRKTNPSKSPYEIIKPMLNKFSIGKIDFENISLKYIDINENNTNTLSVNKLNVSLKDFLIDETSASDTSRIYLLKDIAVNLKNYSYLTENKRYEVKIKKLDYSTSTGELKLTDFKLEPKFSEMEFGKQLGYRKDRFDLRLNNISLKGINLPLYIKKQEINATEMLLEDGKVSIFNDESLPRATKESKIGKYPHQVLQNLDLGILVQKINIKNFDINYAAFGAKSKQRGAISFEHTNGVLSNFTNLKEVKKKDSTLKINLTSYLMGEGKLESNFAFSLNSPTGAFNYAGTLHNTNARTLNRITKPLGLLQINRGIVDKLDFSFQADDYKSIGKVKFWYYNLSVGLMRNDAESGGLVKMGLMSFLANALMINSQNPNVNGDLVIADVNYQRPEHTSFFNLIWKSIFIGIKYSVGLTDEKQNKMKAHIEKFKAIKASKEKRRNRKNLKEQIEKKLR